MVEGKVVRAPGFSRRLSNGAALGKIRALAPRMVTMQRRRPAPADLEFARIVEQQRARVRCVLRGRGVAERDLPDAEQDVFLVVHRKLGEFEGRSSLGTWLHRIARNVASEHRRRAHRRYESLAQA